MYKLHLYGNQVIGFILWGKTLIASYKSGRFYCILSCNSLILSTNIGGQINYGHEPNKAFLVTDSWRVTERNGNSINADITDDAIEND